MRTAAASNKAGADSSPKKRSQSALGTPKRNDPGGQAFGCPGLRDQGSVGSKPRAAANTVAASALLCAKIETQSSVRQAGTIPEVLSAPRVAFHPAISLNAAGTRPEPAVSVPRENEANPRATATADPELEPPEI